MHGSLRIAAATAVLAAALGTGCAGWVALEVGVAAATAVVTASGGDDAEDEEDDKRRER